VNSAVKLSAPESHQFWEIEVVYEDDELLALDKPSGLLTCPDRYDPKRPNLMKLLHQGITKKSAWASQRNLDYLANVHRLDIETSGIILLAKTKLSFTALVNQFGTDKPQKTYLALAHGCPTERTFACNAPLASHPVKLGVMRVDSHNGKRAETRFEVIEEFARYCLLKCQPLTERTHQIRVHLRSLGFPLVGDTTYGGKPLLLSQLKPGYRFKENTPEHPLMQRVALHAQELSVVHPTAGNTVSITAPPPKDLVVALKYLRKFGMPAAGLSPAS
jgi:RluA family pseudouridine synthase